MSKRRHNLNRGGFTLLELTLALAMVAGLAVSMYETMYSAFRAEQSATVAVEPSRTAQLAMEFLRTDLQNALPPDTNPNVNLQGNFEGAQSHDDRGNEADDIQFYTTSDARDDADGNGEIKFVELTVETTGGGDHVLVRRITRNLLPPDGTTAQTPEEEVICRGVWSFTAQYFNGTVWEANWDSTALDNTLPVAVQLTLQIQRPGANGMQTLTYPQIIAMSCSTAAQDPNVNGG